MPRIHDVFLDSREFARVARAIRFIDASFREQPSLATVARHVALSEFHFNRLFRRWAGLTPRQYLAAVTAAAARGALAREGSVLAAAHAVGLSGAGRLHDLTVTLEAFSPGELRERGAGVRIWHGFAATPFGTAHFAETPRGLCHLAFIDAGGRTAAERELFAAWPRALFQRDDARCARLAGRLWGEGTSPEPLRLAVAGTNFQVKVWRALLELPRGMHTTYRDIALRLGAPLAARAVGNAVGANPVAWIIPCHRVLRAGAALGGYRWGGERKRAMLAWEAMVSGAMAPPRRPAVNL